MNIFMTGATGYIGGSVAVRLVQLGHEVTALVRTDEGAASLVALGMTPVPGALDDAGTIAQACRSADAVVDTADANHAGVVAAIVDALRGSGKAFLHTSGSGIVANCLALAVLLRIDFETPAETAKDVRMAMVALAQRARAPAGTPA